MTHYTSLILPARTGDTIEMSTEITVEIVRAMASDEMVVQAAQVSVKGKNDPLTDSPRLINYLMESGHGSPFEHNMFTFFVEAPIFVFREWHRHRIASINEMSGRYSQLIPKFYTPGADRKMLNIGTSARPEMAVGDVKHKDIMAAGDYTVAEFAWKEYQYRLDQGISNELARTILPLSTYSQMYWTVNARSLMNFLSLRIDSKDSRRRSRPQWEIQMGAEKMEVAFKEYMPHTHAAFVANGRVAP